MAELYAAGGMEDEGEDGFLWVVIELGESIRTQPKGLCDERAERIAELLYLVEVLVESFMKAWDAGFLRPLMYDGASN